MIKKVTHFLFVILIVFSIFGTANSWGHEGKRDLLSDEERVIYHKRLEELQKLGEELFYLIVNKDVDKLISLMHEEILVGVGIDRWMKKSELMSQLKNKSSFEYCRLFDGNCFQEKIKVYLKDYKKWQSLRDYLKSAKNLKITAEIKEGTKKGYYLNWGLISFDWEEKPDYLITEAFATASFIYRDGKWWLSNLFCVS